MEILSSKTIEIHQEEFDHAMKIFNWNKYLLSTFGLWPNNPSNFLFIISFVYFTYSMFCEYLDLFLFIDNLEHVIENLTENMAFTQLLVRMAMLKKYNHQIGIVINEAVNDYNAKLYNNFDEKKAFLDYINRAKLFVKLLCAFMAMTITSYYIKPITCPPSLSDDHSDMTMTYTDNSTLPFILPYRFHIFYEINDFKSYAMTYALQFPFALIAGLGQTAADCLIVTLVFHVSGQLSVLSVKINSINPYSNNCKEDLSVIIRKHTRLLRMGQSIDEVFNEGMLAYLFGATALVCILGYQLLVNSRRGQEADLATFFVYILLVLLILYAFCYVGESLITESNNVCEAFYDCLWYEMPQKTAKLIIQCIKRSQQPLGLSAGKLGTFRLSTLTEVVKTAMGYLSVLRSFLVDK